MYESLKGREWGLPILWLLWSRGGCLERGIVAYMLGVKVATVRRMAWGLSRQGLLEAAGQRLCITVQGKKVAERVVLAARHGRKYVLALPGLLVYVVHRDSGARARPIPCSVAHSVYEAVLRGASRPSEISKLTGIAPKTASYVAKALRVLGCPGQACLLEQACPAGREGKG